jgi:hypothetical protein
MTRSVPTGNEGTHVNVEGDYMVAIAVLPVSQTKGRGPGRSNLQSEVTSSVKCTSTYKRKRTVDGCNTPGVTIAATIHIQFLDNGCYSINLIQGRCHFLLLELDHLKSIGKFEF